MKQKQTAIIFALGTAVVLSACGGTGNGMEGQSQSASAVQEENEQEEAIVYEKDESIKTELITPADSFAGGDGTEQSPWQIATKEQLALLSTVLYEQQEGYRDDYYVLTADIALNDTSDYDHWDEKAPQYGWMPIGSDTNQKGHHFEGHFNGDGHTVSGMYLYTFHQQEESDIYSNAGLFGSVYHAVVENLMLTDSYIRADGKSVYAGGIAAEAFGSEFRNCHGSVEITADHVYQAGGILGKGLETDIVDCHNEGNITVGARMEKKSSAYAGGIAGSLNWGEISGCKNDGNIICSGYIDAGGIAGSIAAGKNAAAGEAAGSIMKDCANTGMVQVKDGTMITSVGGLVGSLSALDSNLEITDCTNAGLVDAQEGNYAGLFGWMSVTGGEIRAVNCTNEGMIEENAADNGMSAGIAAYLLIENGSMGFENCVNKTDIASVGETIAGGITGSVILQKGGSLELADCVNEGNISANSSMGGMIAMLTQISHEERPAQIRLTGCTNHGTLTGEGWNIGGIVGMTEFLSAPHDSFEMNDCRNDGDIRINSPSDSTIMLFGGLAGKLYSKECKITLTNSTNEGDIIYTSVDDRDDETQERKYSFAAGGLAGALVKDAQINDCINKGKLIVNGEEKPMNNDGVGMWMEKETEE